MNIFPEMNIKLLNDCKDGELLLSRWENGICFISTTPDKSRRIIIRPAHILQGHVFARGEIISPPIHHRLVSLGVNYRIEVDPISIIYSDDEAEIVQPGWLQFTSDGFSMLYTSSIGGVFFEFDTGLSFIASDQKYSSAKCYFTKWAVVIDNKDSNEVCRLFEFDATVKHQG